MERLTAYAPPWKPWMGYFPAPDHPVAPLFASPLPLAAFPPPGGRRYRGGGRTPDRAVCVAAPVRSTGGPRSSWGSAATITCSTSTRSVERCSGSPTGWTVPRSTSSPSGLSLTMRRSRCRPNSSRPRQRPSPDRGAVPRGGGAVQGSNPRADSLTTLWTGCGECCGNPGPSPLPCHPSPPRPPPRAGALATVGGEPRRRKADTPTYPPRGRCGWLPRPPRRRGSSPRPPPPKPGAPGRCRGRHQVLLMGASSRTWRARSSGLADGRWKRRRSDPASSEAYSFASRAASGTRCATTPNITIHATAVPAVCVIRSAILAR
jgi:hypothetical protein